MRKCSIALIFVAIWCQIAQAQEEPNYPEPEKKSLQVNLTKDGSTNIRFISLLQTWIRYTDLNPGSVVGEQLRPSATDLSLRRIVFTTVAQFHPRALFLLNVVGNANGAGDAFQSGLNVGILDAYGEYKISKALFIGAGLHPWTGFSRLNVDGIGSLLNLDQPAFQQVTWNRLDKLGQVMGVYVKGEVGKLNYRLSLNEPFTPTPSAFGINAGRGTPNGGSLGKEARNAQVNVAYFNPSATSKLLQGYFEYAFWDTENHITPYEISTYQGGKKLLNIGTGFMYRKDGILTPTQITLQNSGQPEGDLNPKIIHSARTSDLFAWAVDAIVMYPFSNRLDGITLYAGYYSVDLGPNYYTVSNVNNIATATQGASLVNGAGNAYPATGTGQTFYTQAGYILPNTLFPTTRLGVFTTYQHSKLDALKDPVTIYEGGFNWFINANQVKFTMMYRNRPVFKGSTAFADQSPNAVVDVRKGEVIAQFQVNF
ncbi:hypothetical protein [Spirosoma arcticum]